MIRLFTHQLKLRIRCTEIAQRLRLSTDYDVIIVRKKVGSKHNNHHMRVTIYHAPPPPPSFALSTTMYNEPAAQRDQSTPFAMSNTHESDARDVPGVSSMGGSRGYNHDYSSSFREVSVRSHSKTIQDYSPI